MAGFAAVFVARALDNSGTSGIPILYVLPIVFIAVELGRRAGFVAGVTGFLLFLAWASHSPLPVTPMALVSRGIVYVLVGVVAGHLADRLHAALMLARASARHFEMTRDMLCTTNAEGYITHLNGAWEQCLGWSAQELMASPFVAFVHPDDLEQTLAESARAMEGEFAANFTNRYRTKDGEWRWIEWAAQLDAENEKIHAVARDVTDRRRADEARREAEERFRRAFDDSATGMAIVGIAGEERDVVRAANDSMSRILGIPHAELVGSKPLHERVDPAHARPVAAGMERLLRGEDAVHRGEMRVRRPDERWIWLDMTASIVRDGDGQPLYRLVQVLDVTERKASEEQLRYLADHDPLSGVYNRRRFEQELQRELDHSGRGRRESVVLLIDVDDFKAINDTLGHATGDAVIAGLGDALRRRLRSGDVVARLGGDEFAVLLRRVDIATALELARCLRELASAQLTSILGDGRPPVTLSVGLAPIGGADDEPATIDELLGRADRALYAAKDAGKDRVVAFSDAEPAVSDLRLRHATQDL